jgi:alanine racemase
VDAPLIYPPPSLPPRAWLEIDLAAVRRNACAMQACAMQARAGAALIPMVKADAYGVGAAGVVRALEPLDPYAYGVATVAEGRELRASGVTRPVLIFTPLLVEELAAAAAADLTPTLGSAASITAWSATGRPYHLAIDTGMNRAGVSWRDVAAVRDAVRAAPPAGAFTHFHSAELSDGTVAEQERRFRAALDEIGVNVPFLHTENSAAIARSGGAWQGIRPGVFLYGVGSGDHAPVRPDPVVSMRARVVDVRTIEPGDTVSYDATYRAERRSRIATVAVGYGDGYPRGASNHATALVRGVRVPLRGLVTMDMIMLDVTSVSCEIGDVATLIGRDGDDVITVEEVAAHARISPYELLTGLRGRLDRYYHDAGTAGRENDQ